MIKVIKTYLESNNYTGQGLIDYLNSISRKKAYWCAGTTNLTSGIIQVGRQKYYFYCIKPWHQCPTGRVIVEEVIK